MHRLYHARRLGPLRADRFRPARDEMEIRAASATDGGIIEIRLDTPDGELLCLPGPKHGRVANVGYFQGQDQAGERNQSSAVFKGNLPAVMNPQLWFGQVDKENTTIWAQFKGVNPNEQLVEINVRQTVFYPEKTGHQLHHRARLHTARTRPRPGRRPPPSRSA